MGLLTIMAAPLYLRPTHFKEKGSENGVLSEQPVLSKKIPPYGE
jgi:hypothetical protein